MNDVSRPPPSAAQPLRLRDPVQNIVGVLHLVLATVLSVSQRGEGTTPLQYEWRLLIALPFLATSSLLFTAGIIRGFERRWRAMARGIFALLIGWSMFYWARERWPGPLNPWEKFGVTSSWINVGAARQLHAKYEVYHQGRTISGTVGPSRSYDWTLRAEDRNGDGQPDVVVQDGPSTDTLIFTPPSGGKPPFFKNL